MSHRRWLLASLIILSASSLSGQQVPTAAQHVPPPDGTWTFDAVVDQASVVTDSTLGAGQGVAVRDGKLYAYGDVWSADPRTGVIREYDLDLKPTGRTVWLRKGGKPLILHPTGLTWDDRFGTFLGDTVNKKATIYRLDWEQAWRDGNLDSSVLDTVEDDAAVNGCRPEFVKVGGRTLLATADYGEIHPELRLLDPEALLKARRTSAPGVVVHRVLAGPWNQNLSWDRATGRLVCIENVIEGRGWRLDILDLEKAVADGRADGPGVRVERVTFEPHDELEGYCRLDRSRVLFITSNRSGNLVAGVVRPADPRPTPPPPQP
jgi:hypothetical protein